MRIAVIASLPRSVVAFRGDLIRSLVAAGHQVSAIAPGMDTEPDVVRFLDESGAGHYDVPLNRSGLNPLSDLHTGLALYRRLGRIRPELVLAYTIKPVVWGTLVATTLRIPRRVVLVTGLGFSFAPQPTIRLRATAWLARRLYRAALSRATHIIFQNPDDHDECRGAGLLPGGAVASVVDGSGVDLERFGLEKLPPPRPIRFLMVARLLGDKGVREYAAAAAMLSDSAEVEFHLVGGTDPSPNGIPSVEVEKWASQGTLVWHGEVEDVRSYLRSCHVFVLPSYREGLPRSTQEAMATGRAILTTDVPGCRETVIDGINGFKVAPGSVSALVEAMKKFIDAPELLMEMGAASRRIAGARFDVNKVNQAMLAAMGVA